MAPRLRARGFTLVEVMGVVVILSVVLLALRGVLAGAEGRMAQSRCEALVGRRVRFYQNLVTACPYDMLPADGDTQMEAGSGFEPWDSQRQSWRQLLPYTVTLRRQRFDVGTSAERSELQVTVSYTVGADVGSTSNANQARTRTSSLVVRRPAEEY